MDTADLIAQIRTYDLERHPFFDLSNLESIHSIYNGIGPDWIPKEIRDWLTSRFGYFAAATVIHDWEYHNSDRTMTSFLASNERLRRNCKRLLEMKGCPWYKAWLCRRRVDLLADACNEFGWSAWVS